MGSASPKRVDHPSRPRAAADARPQLGPGPVRAAASQRLRYLRRIPVKDLVGTRRLRRTPTFFLPAAVLNLFSLLPSPVSLPCFLFFLTISFFSMDKFECALDMREKRVT